MMWFSMSPEEIRRSNVGWAIFLILLFGFVIVASIGAALMRCSGLSGCGQRIWFPVGAVVVLSVAIAVLGIVQGWRKTGDETDETTEETPREEQAVSGNTDQLGIVRGS